MALYKIAQSSNGAYHLIKETAGGRKATIIPVRWDLMSQADFNATDDIVQLDQYEHVRDATES